MMPPKIAASSFSSPEYSKNGNLDACTAVEKWFLSEDAQRLIMQGFMHSTFRNMQEYPWHSIDTNELIEKDLGVDWENVYRNREAINTAWTVKVTSN